MPNKQNVMKFFTKRNKCTQCTTTIDASWRSTDTHTSVGTISITEGQSSALSINNTPVCEIRHMGENRHHYSNMKHMIYSIILRHGQTGRRTGGCGLHARLFNFVENY
jgi:hypothetical protein